MSVLIPQSGTKPERPIVLELKLQPDEWRVTIIAITSFLADINDASADLAGNDDGLASATVATILSAFQMSIRTALSLRGAINVSLQRRAAAPRVPSGSSRVAVRHAALSALPGILEDAASRLTDQGSGDAAKPFLVVSGKIRDALATADFLTLPTS